MKRLLAILCLAPGLALAQSNWYVSSAFGTDTNTGLSWENAKSNLQSLVQSLGATTTNVVWVGAGDYVMTNGPLLLTSAQRTRIVGTNRESVRLIGAGYPWRVVMMSTTNQWLVNLTVTGGSLATGGAAGVLGTYGAASHVSNCVIVSNFNHATGSGSGGAGNVVLYDSVVEWNVSRLGGGGAGYVVAYDSVFRHNSATGGAQGSGGGVDAASLYRCTVVSNSASNAGGGLNGVYAEGCLVAWNQASNAGGGASGGSFLNSTVEWNSAASSAGSNLSGSTGTVYRFNYAAGSAAAFNGGGHAYAFVCSNSSANVNGPEITMASVYSSVVHGDSSRIPAKSVPLYNMVDVRNCTIVGYTDTFHKVHMGGNATKFFNNVLWTDGTNLAVNSTNQGWNVTNDPLFLGEAGFPYKISSASPCIDAGNDAYVATALDFYGRDRTQGTVDVGAVEYQLGIDDPPPAATGKLRLILNMMGGSR